MMGQNYFKGGQTRVWEANIYKYNEINNNSENFRRGNIASRGGGGGFPPGAPLSWGPARNLAGLLVIVRQNTYIVLSWV